MAKNGNHGSSLERKRSKVQKKLSKKEQNHMINLIKKQVALGGKSNMKLSSQDKGKLMELFRKEAALKGDGFYGDICSGIMGFILELIGFGFL